MQPIIESNKKTNIKCVKSHLNGNTLPVSTKEIQNQEIMKVSHWCSKVTAPPSRADTVVCVQCVLGEEGWWRRQVDLVRSIHS